MTDIVNGEISSVAAEYCEGSAGFRTLLALGLPAEIKHPLPNQGGHNYAAERKQECGPVAEVACQYTSKKRTGSDK